MKTVTILGATGSVGTSTLDLVEREPDRFRVIALTANCDVERLAAAAIRTHAQIAAVADEGCLPALREALAGTGVRAIGGPSGVDEAARSGADWTMGAIVGCAGLEPVMAAIEGRRDRRPGEQGTAGVRGSGHSRCRRPATVRRCYPPTASIMRSTSVSTSPGRSGSAGSS